MSAAEAPAPAPGQRWRLDCGCVVDLGSDKSRYGCVLLLEREVKCGLATTHFGWVDAPDWFLGAVYVGPTPGYVPSPATPTPAAAPPTVAGVGGPRVCADWCGLPTIDDRVPTCVPGRSGPQEGVDRFTDRRSGLDYTRSWCSSHCRDARVVPGASAAPPTREQILAEELRGKAATVKQPLTVDPGVSERTTFTAMAGPNVWEEAHVDRLLTSEQWSSRVSMGLAMRAEARKQRDTFADLQDDFDNLPDADAAPVRYRR